MIHHQQPLQFTQAGTSPHQVEQLVNKMGLGEISHFGRPLSRHLIGTYALLQKWNNPHEICIAGLFHSVYGTKTFLPSALDPESRPQLQALIGHYAEQLVFLFGFSDRKRLLLENIQPPFFWVHHRTGERTEIGTDTLNHLIEIEVANFIEQMPHLDDLSATVIHDMSTRFTAHFSRLSAGARAAVQHAL